MSEIYQTFLAKLPASIAAMKLITEPEQDYLLQLVEKRMLRMYGDAHGIAYPGPSIPWCRHEFEEPIEN